MGKEDWAVVIGLTHYPGINHLKGPENDANLFYEWLVKESGGDVPKEQIIKILSSDFQPPSKVATNAMPSDHAILMQLEGLQDKADEAAGRLGRRLYLFMAGHGFSDQQSLEGDTLLLTANASPARLGHHIVGEYTAKWFRLAGHFDEVILLMDCCREKLPVPVVRIPWGAFLLDEALDKGRYFHGFATKWSRKSRERKMENGKVHGVFTWALVKGLEKGAVDPDTGEITAASLNAYLDNHTKDFLTKRDIADPLVPKAPEIDVPFNQANTFVIVEKAKDFVGNGNGAAPLPLDPTPVAPTPEAPTFVVTLQLPPNAMGKEVRIFDGALEEIKSKTLTATTWRLRLKRGLYSVETISDGKKTPFEVGGTGNVTIKI